METKLPADSRNPAPFHRGEIDAQERAGVREQMARVGAVVIRDYMPEQHREFFPLLPTLLAGGIDRHGEVWASILCGEPGFVSSPDNRTLRIAALPAAQDPLAPAMQPGQRLGLLGLQFETRRRNRANGIVSELDERGFTLAVQQSFGNCPKYIQTREIADARFAAAGEEVLAGDGALPQEAVALIRRSDTFFIATASNAASGAADDSAYGADVSHRGGRPGFVAVDADGSLCWPDFIGNNFFNTIGNLVADGRAGLLFIDFEQGDILQMSGRGTVEWAGERLRQFAGAQRLLRFEAGRWLLRKAAFPLRWALQEQSPHLERTGAWNQ
ncbi:pyridoxamine 5'-phosphate oxidase family protein [Noviherbaspirillum sp. CPCC 100848]|uniref:Pyridoxamine 5'-phosphate oxidase family protein n=1 Tax=Noviherbaspirillum album TaxID=3080276 RepID=A0ABU6JBC7_9BURK|nr:pyridoxamine 5'-phosphate oxidase family protein [Noviherbaspirillum sp. CPCC 100848]MEC4720610.1 pyridoxamine 5'-phosphate oxidase family protein [Noviherbaspirillum sp. CPCC 100848]